MTPNNPTPGDELVERLRKLPCVMVEVCEPHSGNPSPNIIPIAKKDLIAALKTSTPETQTVEGGGQ